MTDTPSKKEGTYPWQAKAIPKVGKDHLVLADWRLSISKKDSITHITNNKENAGEEKCGVIAYKTTRADGSTQTVVHESGAVTPFPVTKDDLVLVALITLSSLAKHPQLLWFDVAHILALLRWPNNGHYKNKVKQALERFEVMTSRFDGVWYNRKDNSADAYTGRIIAECTVVTKPGRRTAGERLCKLQWSDAFHQSLVDGNLLSIDLVRLAEFSQPLAAQYFRHLNKTWHSGNKLFIYDRDLTELACGHLLMADSNWMKRNFTKQVLRPHEKAGTLNKVPDAERFYGKRGRWRVRNTPGPAWESQTPAKASVNEARVFVETYHQRRHGIAHHRPTKKELAAADRLLAKSTLDALLAVIDDVVTQLKSGKGDDVHFQYAETIFRHQVAKRKEVQATHIKQAVHNKKVDQLASRKDDDRQAQEASFAKQKALWASASEAQRIEASQLALENDQSQVVQDRILNSTLDNPVPEMLNALEQLLQKPHPLVLA